MGKVGVLTHCQPNEVLSQEMVREESLAVAEAVVE